MKNTRALVMIAISVGIAIAAVIIAANWVARQSKAATSKAVVAARDLEIGTRLRADMLQVVDWPAAAAVKGMFTEPKPLIQESKERVVNVQVQRGEPITEAKLAPPGEKGGLSAVLKDGKRAITVRVNEIVGVAGFALPGNYVDVMVHAADAQNKPVSKIVLEQILVLAVAQEVSQSDVKPRVVNAVTLEVTPQQAETIDLARSVGSLSLVLRSQSDRAAGMTTGARKDDLLRLSATSAEAVKAEPVAKPVARVAPRPAPIRAAEPAAKPEPDKIEVIRGVSRKLEQPQATP